MIYTVEFENGQHINLLQHEEYMGYDHDNEYDELKKNYPNHPYPAYYTLVIKNDYVEDDFVHKAFEGDSTIEFETSITLDSEIINDCSLSNLLEWSREYTNTLFLISYTSTDKDPDVNLGTLKLISIIERFVKDCRERNSGNQLVLLTDRFELMDYYTNPGTIWLYNNTSKVDHLPSLYSLYEFKRIEEFSGKFGRNYRIGRFGGL
jgi:hypothetical protein